GGGQNRTDGSRGLGCPLRCQPRAAVGDRAKPLAGTGGGDAAGGDRARPRGGGGAECDLVGAPRVAGDRGGLFPGRAGDRPPAGGGGRAVDRSATRHRVGGSGRARLSTGTSAARKSTR